MKCPHEIILNGLVPIIIEALEDAGITVDGDAVKRFVESLDHDQIVTVLGIICSCGKTIKSTLQAIAAIDAAESAEDRATTRKEDLH